jgi:alpha-N-arabinofuranosidase
LEGLTYGRGLDLLDYVAVHIYSGGGTSDTGFAEDEYYNLMARVPFMDDYIANVVDLCVAYSTDDHKIGVILDEWGTWFQEATVKTGLYQQNTMQDAIFAAASFHRFHKHEGLFMANMAQTVNVLQALILTRGPNMVMTPTYHVYAMLAPHRDSERVEVAFESPKLTANDMDALSVSATRTDDGLFVSIVNMELDRAFSADLAAGGWQIGEVRQLAADDVHAHNTFEDAAAVAPVDVAYEGGALSFPPASITTIRMKET